MVLEPPEGFRISMSAKKEGYGDYAKPPAYKPMRRAAVKTYSWAFRTLGSPRMLPVLGKADLIHVDGCVIPITRSPWVVGSIEHASNFFSFDDDWHRVPSMRRRLLKGLRSSRCRKALCLSEAAAETLQLGLGDGYESIEDKVDIVYPAVPSNRLRPAERRSRHDGPIRILFVGSHFFDKGGRELLHAFNRIRERHDARLDLVTGSPPHHRTQYERVKREYANDSAVRFLSDVPRSILWNDLYGNADIFCFPSYMETFGYVVLEAMANELPVVATRQFAIPEMVRHDETGLLVDPPIASFERGVMRSEKTVKKYLETVMQESVFSDTVDSLEREITKLITDRPLRDRLARAGYESVERGCFSVKHRNEKLARVYREALGTSRPA